MEKTKNYLKLSLYTKGGSTYYCNYYFYNGINYERGTTKAGGYGYDKQSTAASNAINKYKMLFNIKKGVKWPNKNSMHAQLKDGTTTYGVYNDKTISYGIGLSSVLNSLKVFSNVKVIETFFGDKETFIKIEIKTTQKQLKKIIEKNNKIINNKKTDKDTKKTLKTENKKIKVLFDL